jgi:hypothetical protein
VLSGTASADVEESSIAPVPPVSAGIFFTGFGGTGVGGMGPTVEVAFGANQTQYVLEGGISWVRAGVPEHEIKGRQLRGAAGLRWIARSFELDRNGAIEFALEAFGGVHRIAWYDGGDLTQPEFSFGWVVQGRHYRRPGVRMGMSMRAVLTRAPEDDKVFARCATCEPTKGTFSSAGIMIMIGASL